MALKRVAGPTLVLLLLSASVLAEDTDYFGSETIVYIYETVGDSMQDLQRRALPAADSKDEYKSYSGVVAKQTPQEILEESAKFLEKYEKSDLRSLVYQGMVNAAIRLNDLQLAFDIGRKALSEYPDHMLVMTQLVTVSANKLLYGDKAYVVDAEKYAHEVLGLVEAGKMPYGYKPDRWKAYLPTVVADMNCALGIVALYHHQDEQAAVERLSIAVQNNPYEPYAYYLLGKAQVAIYQKANRSTKKPASSLSLQAKEQLSKIADTYAKALLLTESESYKSLRAALEYDIQSFGTSLGEKIKAELANAIELARSNNTLLAKPPATAATPNP
ncbi:MAG: hypothetical protein RMM17_08860 [Acidobacteriota bacterium]|nr:hypothetical protein [Blastocatellia bacterium]MDW8412776.1 hypothetical protein [Acidobacteriota bacterium]